MFINPESSILLNSIGLKPSAFVLQAHIHKHQLVAMAKATRSLHSRAKKPQSRAKKPQSRAKAPQSRAKAQSRSCKVFVRFKLSKGWKACVKFLRKDYKEMCNASRPSVQLLRITSCSELMHGFEAEVNWYTGGNEYVTLPTAVAEAKPGVYLAKTKWLRLKDFAQDDVGPQTPVASIDHLRWLGTTRELMAMTKASRKELGKKKYDRLVEMLACNN